MRNSVVLPAPFGPITPTMPPRGSVKVTSSMRRTSPYPFRTPRGLDDHVAEPRARRDVDLGGVHLVGRVLGEQLLVRGEAGLALGLARPRRHADPLELALEGALPLGLGLLLLHEPVLLLLEPRGVVALPRDARAAIELEDPARDVVEEVPVVGDRDDGARVRAEEVLEPGDRLGVEMVGRLVEQQQIGRGEQQPAERDAAALASGERGDVGVARRTAQRVHRHLDLRVDLPGADLVDAVLHAALLGEDLVHLVGRQVFGEARVQVVVAREQRPHLGDALLDVAFHVLGRVEARLLRQEADLDALGRERLADEVRVLARHDAQQRRLARAVQAEHADLGAGEEREPDVLEDLVVGRVDLPEPFHGVDELWCHRGG